MATRRVFLSMLLVAFVAGACGATAATPSPTAPSLRTALQAKFPALDGSTTAFPLARLIACDLYGIKCVWNAPVTANKERTYIPDPSAGISESQSKRILDIKFNTTHNAYVNLIDGKVDAILEARAPSPDELAEAKSKGFEFEITPVALDAFVFLANTSNPVESLPAETIRDIYRGKITTWKQAGVTMSDPQAAIHPYQRERNSGSQEQLEQVVMHGEKAIDAPDMIVKTMLGPFNAIGGDPTNGSGGDKLGFAYTFYYYFTVMFANPNVKTIAVDGVQPNASTIKSRTYPLACDVLLVTRKGAASDSAGVRFRDWMLSPDGQRLIQESGYVAIGPTK